MASTLDQMPVSKFYSTPTKKITPCDPWSDEANQRMVKTAPRSRKNTNNSLAIGPVADRTISKESLSYNVGCCAVPNLKIGIPSEARMIKSEPRAITPKAVCKSDLFSTSRNLFDSICGPVMENDSEMIKDLTTPQKMNLNLLRSGSSRRSGLSANKENSCLTPTKGFSAQRTTMSDRKTKKKVLSPVNRTLHSYRHSSVGELSIKTIFSSPSTLPKAKKEDKKGRKLSKKGRSQKPNISPTRTAMKNARSSATKLLKKLSPKRASSASYPTFVLRSSEHEPSPFQIEIPQEREFFTHAKICAFMGHHSDIDNKFDFSTIEGLSRGALDMKYSYSSAQKVGGGSQPPIVMAMLECADDIVLEGFFCEENDVYGKVEVGIFSSQNQFIVSYRGSDGFQAKPLKNKQYKYSDLKGANTDLHLKVPTPVLPIFRDVYFTGNLEESVFGVLAKLTSSNPFCDVVMTGHSFGAALATIGAVRYATLRPMMRVSCHAFGSPRIGGLDFRLHAHSLPNLKIVRVEHGVDPFVSMPEGTDWFHVGHTIRMNINYAASSGNSADENTKSASSPSVQIQIFKFDKKRPVPGLLRTRMNKMISNPKNMILGSSSSKPNPKNDQVVTAYVCALEKIISLGLKWSREFVGEEGQGVCGSDNEMRHVV